MKSINFLVVITVFCLTFFFTQTGKVFAFDFTPFFPRLLAPQSQLFTFPVSSSSAKEQAADISSTYCLQVPILLYHHIEPMKNAIKEKHEQLTTDSEVFAMQMKYLRDTGYHAIFLSELVDALIGHNVLPEKSIAVTIDDGYSDNYTYALPILEKYGLRGNFMIPTGLIMNPGYMTWDNLRDIQNRGDIALYNHTWSHAALDTLTPEKVKYELSVSQQQFEEQLGIKPDIFTYPYGTFNTVAIEVLKQFGFKAAFTTIHGRLQCDTQIMTLYREHVGNVPLFVYGL